MCACALQAAHDFAEGVKHIDGLQVVGKPDMCVVAIKSTSKQLNIYKVNDLMSQRGWHLNALQFPSSVHMCFTAQHTEVVPQLLKVIMALTFCFDTVARGFGKNVVTDVVKICCCRTPGVSKLTSA